MQENQSRAPSFSPQAESCLFEGITRIFSPAPNDEKPAPMKRLSDLINASGLIRGEVEVEGSDRERAQRMTRGIDYNLRKVFQIAKRENMPTYLAADTLGEERLARVRHLKGMSPGQHVHRSRGEAR